MMLLPEAALLETIMADGSKNIAYGTYLTPSKILIGNQSLNIS